MRLHASAALAFAALTLGACYREASDLTASTMYARHKGTAPWEVDGIRPGQSIEQVKSLLGEPRDSVGTSPKTYRWNSPREMAVTVDADETVTEVMGASLTAGGKRIVWGGLSEKEVAHILGSGEVTRARSPGSFVVPTPSKVTGTTMTYRNGGYRFEIMLDDRDMVRRVLARK